MLKQILLLYIDLTCQIITTQRAAALQEKCQFVSRRQLISPKVAVFIQIASSLCNSLLQ